jgi:hypothetical protein
LLDVPEGPECWTVGFDAGANDEFDQDRDDECKDKGDQYGRGYDAGLRVCHDPEKASVEVDDCEKARDES